MSRSSISSVKRFFLIFSFLCLFLIQPTAVLAQSQNSDDEPKDWWGEIWDAIADLLENLGFYIPVIKPVDVSSDNTADLNNNYNEANKNLTTRATSDTVNSYNKGVYLNDVLNNKFGYENIHLSYGCNNSCSKTKIDDGCIDITVKSLVYYFYTRNIKVLYDRGSYNPIDYDASKFSAQDKVISDGECYQNLYNNYPFVPQGSFQNRDNAAAGSSTQMNFALRTPVPASQQGDDINQDLSTAENAKAVAEDNDKQENTMLDNFIPESARSNSFATKYSSQLLAQNASVTDSNQAPSTSQNLAYSKEERRQVFTDYLHPYSWQDEDVPERDDLPDDAGGEYTGTCNALKSHCRGMSQYGALGMSQASFSYESILKFYYGDVELVPISTVLKPDGTFISNSPDVKVDFVEENDCGGGSTIDLEDYLSGLGEMPDYWGNSSKGGFEALKAQVVAARTYAMMRTSYFKNKICNSSRCQVFRCSNLHQRPNLNRAIEATKGLVLIDRVTRKPFSTEYARSFCGPSRQVVYKNVHTNPSVNGIEYERQARNGEQPFCK